MKIKLVLALFLIIFTGTVSSAPDNVSVQLTFNPSTVIVDGETKSSTFSTTNFDNPFISSDQPIGVIGYRSPSTLSYIQDTNDELKVFSSSAETSFLIPFTTGGYSSLLNRENEIQDNTLMNLVGPNFGFEQGDPVTEVIYDFQYPVEKVIGSSSDFFSITVRNRIDSDNQTQFKLKTE